MCYILYQAPSAWYGVRDGASSEELIKQYEASIDYCLDLDRKKREPEEGIKAGRAVDFDTMREETQERFGV